MKRFISGFVTGLVLAATLAMGVTVLAESSGIQLIINGVNITSTMDVKPQIIDGRTMVPAKYVAEALGAEVGWEQATQTVTVTSKNLNPAPSQTSTTPSYIPGASTVVGDSSLYGARINNSSIANGSSAVVTVSANKATTKVKVTYDDGTVIAESTNYTTDSQGNYFDVTITPNKTGTSNLRVYGGTGNGYGTAYKSISVTVGSQSDIEIKSITLKNTTVSEDETVEVTIKTSTDVTKVAIFDSKDKSVKSTTKTSSQSSSTYTWVLTFSAGDDYGTNTYYVYAYDNYNNEEYEKFTFKVGEGSSSSSLSTSDIVDYEIYDEDRIEEYDVVDIEVETKNNVRAVAIFDKYGDELDYTTSYYESGSRYYWELDFDADYEGTYYIYAYESTSSSSKYVKKSFTISFYD